MKNRNTGRALLAAAASLFASALLIGVIFHCSGRSDRRSVDTSAGIAYIQELETESVDDVKQALKDIRAEKLTEECEERIAVLEDDQSQVWKMLDDYLFMGDSRCVSWVYYGFMTEEQCIAEEGVNIVSHLEKNIDRIAEVNPAYLYLGYGVNDISCGLWHTADEYSAEYARILDEIHAAVPDTKIYLNSILPTTEGAWETYDGFRLIPEWNESLKAICEERSFVYYVENTELCEKYSGMYLEDGIHFVKEFYPHWMAHIMITEYQYELQERLEQENNTDSDGETALQETSTGGKNA